MGEKYTHGLLRSRAMGGHSVVLTQADPGHDDFRCGPFGWAEGNGYSIAYPFVDDESRARFDFVCFGHDDACRIVATWNACDSIPTKALEDGVVGEMVVALKLALYAVEAAMFIESHPFEKDLNGQIEVTIGALRRAEGQILAALEKIEGRS